MTLRTPALIATLFLLPLLPGCGGEKPEPVAPPPRRAAIEPQTPCASPREVHARMQAAMRDGQPGRLVGLHAPDDRPLYIFKLVITANFAAAAGGGSETLRSLLVRHDVPDGGKAPEDEDALRSWSRKWLRNVALAPLADDLAAFIGPEFNRAHRGALSGLKIQGDRATAKIGDKTHRFVSIGKAWYLSVEE